MLDRAKYNIPVHLIRYEIMINIIREAGWKIVPLIEFYDCSKDDKVLGIRHDIDVDIDIARAMAKFEYEIGISTSYFLQTTHPYFIQGGPLHANYMSQLNHEVGIHLDCLGIVTNLKQNVHSHLMQTLLILRRHCIIVKGTAVHGSQLAIQEKFVGADYYYDFLKKEKLLYIKDKDGKTDILALGMHFLKEYGLSYEASVMDKVNYISDSNGIFRLTKEVGTSAISKKEITPTSAKNALVEFLNTIKGKTILLAHPIYWNL